MDSQKLVLVLLKLLLGLLDTGFYYEIARELCRNIIGLLIVTGILIIIFLGILGNWLEGKFNLRDVLTEYFTGSINHHLVHIDVLVFFAMIGFVSLIPVFWLWDILSIIKIGLAIFTIVFISLITNDFNHKHQKLAGQSALRELITVISQLFSSINQWSTQRVGLFLFTIIQGLLNFWLYLEIIRELCRTTIGIGILIVILILILGFCLWGEVDLLNEWYTLQKDLTGASSIKDQVVIIYLLLSLAIFGLIILIPVFWLWDIFSIAKIGLAILFIFFLGLEFPDEDYDGTPPLRQLIITGYKLLVYLISTGYKQSYYALKFCWRLLTICFYFCYHYYSIVTRANFVGIDPPDPERLQCAVCMAAEKTVVVESCGHLCMCHQCAQMIFNGIRQCPLCRNHIVRLRNVYL